MSAQRVNSSRRRHKRIGSDVGSDMPPRITVVGGAGAMGRIIVRDLVETAPDDVEIVLADYDREAALAVAHSIPRGRRRRPILVKHVDASRKTDTKHALAGTTVLVNACHHALNVRLMEIALACGSHY